MTKDEYKKLVSRAFPLIAKEGIRAPGRPPKIMREILRVPLGEPRLQNCMIDENLLMKKLAEISGDEIFDPNDVADYERQRRNLNSNIESINEKLRTDPRVQSSLERSQRASLYVLYNGTKILFLIGSEASKAAYEESEKGAKKSTIRAVIYGVLSNGRPHDRKLAKIVAPNSSSAKNYQNASLAPSQELYGDGAGFRERNSVADQFFEQLGRKMLDKLSTRPISYVLNLARDLLDESSGTHIGGSDFNFQHLLGRATNQLMVSGQNLHFITTHKSIGEEVLRWLGEQSTPREALFLICDPSIEEVMTFMTDLIGNEFKANLDRSIEVFKSWIQCAENSNVNLSVWLAPSIPLNLSIVDPKLRKAEAVTTHIVPGKPDAGVRRFDAVTKSSDPDAFGHSLSAFERMLSTAKQLQ